jgi:hypothetical protein
MSRAPEAARRRDGEVVETLRCSRDAEDVIYRDDRHWCRLIVMDDGAVFLLQMYRREQAVAGGVIDRWPKMMRKLWRRRKLLSC